MSLQNRQAEMRSRLRVTPKPAVTETPDESVRTRGARHRAGTANTESRNGTEREQRTVVTESVAPAARVLSLKDAAVYLGVSYWTVRDLVLGGHIPTVRIPVPGSHDGRSLRRILVDRRDLDAFIDRNKESEPQ